MVTMVFRCVGSPMDEMKLLERMRARDPESADNVVANGKLLVEYVQHGNLRAIQCALDHMQEVRRLCTNGASPTVNNHSPSAIVAVC